MISRNKWYVASVIPNREIIAKLNLENQKFEAFSPVYPKLKSRFGRDKVLVFAPLFPGYIFVSFNISGDRWQAINSTYGVRRLLVLGEGRMPTPVPEVVIKRLMQSCPDGVWSLADENLKKGDEVKIVNGCFSGIPAKFLEILPGDRVKLLLQWMGGDVEMSFPSSFIGPSNF